MYALYKCYVIYFLQRPLQAARHSRSPHSPVADTRLTRFHLPTFCNKSRGGREGNRQAQRTTRNVITSDTLFALSLLAQARAFRWIPRMPRASARCNLLRLCKSNVCVFAFVFVSIVHRDNYSAARVRAFFHFDKKCFVDCNLDTTRLTIGTRASKKDATVQIRFSFAAG